MKLKPILYPDPFLSNKIQRKFTLKPLESEHACLLKYFPKYYKNLRISLKPGHHKSVESKVKQLKIIRHFSGHETAWCEDKTFRKLLASSRKTLKRIPSACEYLNYQDISLCTYFIRISALNTSNQSHFYQTNNGKLVETSFLNQKSIYSSYVYFWIGNRFVRSLEVSYFYNEDLMMIKKLDQAKRFLSNLRNLQLNVSTGDMTETPIDFLRSLIENKRFLRHVTCLDLQSLPELTVYWEMIQLLIYSCQNLNSISCFIQINGSNINDFCLDLSGLENLQVLKMNVEHFMTFVKGVEFTSSLVGISLTLVDYEGPDNFKEIFEDSDHEEDDLKDWESFEKFKIVRDFLERWKKLEKLKVLNLNLQAFSDINILVRNFVLPLLGRIPQLETFNFDFYSCAGANGKFFDLEICLKGIEPMRRLKSLRVSTDFRYDCRFDNPLCLSNLSELEIDVKIFSEGFDLKEVLSAFLWREDGFRKKILKLQKVIIFSVQDFIGFLNLIGLASDLKSLQVDLRIYLFVENLAEIFSSLRYAVSFARNISLRVDVFIQDSRSKVLTAEQKQSLKIIFGGACFTVNKIRTCNYQKVLLDPHFLVEEILMQNNFIGD